MKTILKMIISIFLFSTVVYAKKQSEPKMVLQPSTLQTTLDQEHEFTVSGGKPPYVFKTSAGLIRYQGNTATYISPNAAGAFTVTVKDANGATQDVKITVISEPVQESN